MLPKDDINRRLMDIPIEMDSSEEIPLSYCWAVLKNQKWFFMAVFLTTIIATVTGSLLLKPSYQSTATMLLNYSDPNPLEELLNPISVRFSAEYMNTEKSIVESENVEDKVIDIYNLAEDPQILRSYENSIPGPLKRRLFFWRKKKPIRRWLKYFLSENLRVVPNNESRILTITFTSSDPELSARIANAYAEAYNEYHLELSISPMKDSVNWISEKVSELRQNVEDSERRVEEYKAEKGLIASQDRYSITTQKLNQLNSDLVSAEIKLYESSIIIDRLKEIEEKGNNYESLPEVISNHFIQNLKIRKIELENDVSEISKNLGANHPESLRIVSEIETVQNRISAEIDNIVSSIENDNEFVKKLRQALKSALEKQKQKAMQINKDMLGLNLLTQEAEASRNIYDTVLLKFRETTLRGDFNHTNVITIDKATPSPKPSSPNIKLNIALSIIVGFFFGLVIIFFIDYLGNTIKNEKEIETRIGIPVLGVIPK